MADVAVSPDEALVDERLSIRVTGLAPDQRVTLVAEFVANDRPHRAKATFVANPDGVVDLTDHAPVAGDYDRRNPMGLVQFARQVGSDDGNGVSFDGGNVENGHRFRIRARVDGEVADDATVVRRSAPPEVERVPIGDEHDELVGDLFVPPGEGPHPGVVLLGGSEGGIPTDARAKLLAARGYAVLALAYFAPVSSPEDGRNFDSLSDELMEVPLEYAETAVEWFGDHSAVRCEPLGVVGGSRGAELALLMGARFDPVRTVVAYAPSGVVFQGISWKFSWDYEQTAAWAEGGDPLPYVPTRWRWRYLLAVLWHVLRAEPIPTAPTYRGGLRDADSETVESAAIPVEETGGPVLLVAGEDDAMWPSEELGEIAFRRLEERDYEHPYEFLTYEDAGHAVSPPYAPTTERSATSFFPRFSLAAGGTPEGYAAADRDHWEATLRFLERGLLNSESDGTEMTAFKTDEPRG